MPAETGTRERLTHAAAEIIARDGWGAVTTRAVATLADVKPGVIHYHFSTMDELRRTAAIGAVRHLIDPFIEASAALTPAEILMGAAQSSVDDYGPGTDESNLMYEVVLAAARDHELRVALGEVLAGFRSALAARIRECHPDHADRADLLAGLFAGAIDGLQLHLVADPTIDLPGHVELLLELLGPASQEPRTRALAT